MVTLLHIGVFMSVSEDIRMNSGQPAFSQAERGPSNEANFSRSRDTKISISLTAEEGNKAKREPDQKLENSLPSVDDKVLFFFGKE